VCEKRHCSVKQIFAKPSRHAVLDPLDDLLAIPRRIANQVQDDWSAIYGRLGELFDDLHEASQRFYDRLDETGRVLV
jgi:hypothetical protein